jgi:hypothetical protein
MDLKGRQMQPGINNVERRRIEREREKETEK